MYYSDKPKKKRKMSYIFSLSKKPINTGLTKNNILKRKNRLQKLLKTNKFKNIREKIRKKLRNNSQSRRNKQERNKFNQQLRNSNLRTKKLMNNKFKRYKHQIALSKALKKQKKKGFKKKKN